MQYVDYFGHGLHQLVYVSRMASPMSDNQIELIVKQASIANQANNITGALLFYADSFVQVLEGDYANVAPLFRRIETDPRHRDIKLKAVEPIAKRHFVRWGMRLGKCPSTEAIDLFSLHGHQLVTLLALSTGTGPRPQTAKSSAQDRSVCPPDSISDAG